MIVRCFASLLLCAALACSKDSEEKPTSQQTPERTSDPSGAGEGAEEAPAEEKRPAGPTGTIAGKVTIGGEVPKMPKLQRGADPYCARKEMHAETVVVGENGGLKDVHVRIARGGAPAWKPAGPVVIDQTECMYRPRVQGAVIGQELEIKNSDETTHNVHLRALEFGRRQGHETIFNRAQPAGVGAIRATVVDEDVIKLKCDQHAWMQAYVVVSDHPYFGTSGEDGSFTLEKVPVGTYQLEAWHSFYGKKTAEVKVEEGKTAEVAFAYDAKEDNPVD